MALFFAVLLGTACCILGYLIFAFSSENFIRETESAIDADISGFVDLYHAAGETAFNELLQRRSNDASAGRYYLLLDMNEKKLAGNLDRLPEEVWTMSEGIIRFTLPGLRTGREIAAKIHTFSNGKRLLVARDIEESAKTFRHIQWLCIVIIGLMLIVIATSFIISTFVVSRINRIAEAARTIMDTGDLTGRIWIKSSWDDLSNLAQVLNAFLDRIEQLMTGIRQVSDNIAHDLRTPLTRLRNQLEAHADKQHDTTARGACEELVGEADRLLETFNALLRIANIQTGKRHAGFKDFSFDKMMTDVIELYEPLAEEKQINIRYQIAPYTYYGDPHLLFQAVANILHNAIKYTPAEGAISIHLQTNDRGAILTIADTGTGIADTEKSKVFERFYRVDSSRQADGNGLGLSLVAAIIELHAGAIRLGDGNPGLIVMIYL